MSLRVSWDVAEFDFDQIIPAVQESYWGAGRSAADIRRAFAASACVGVFDDETHVGVARAITDQVFHAYVYDVIVFAPFRGRGIAHRIMEGLFAHPQLVSIAGWMLSTRDAHGFYERYGFEKVDADRVMWMRRTV